MLEIIFSVSLFVLYYVYSGYRLFLMLVLAIQKNQGDKAFLGEKFVELPLVTVLVTVYNEQDGIASKLDNLLEQNYPQQRLEIIVASDGSTDATDSIVSDYVRRFPNIHLFCPQCRKGKTDTQNQAIEHSSGSIIVFTDCDTVFSSNFLVNIIRVFIAEEVGCASGELFFQSEKDSSISANQGYYWRYEISLRRLESALGILAVASGACMAVRRDLFRPMEAAYGEDCVIPLDVVLQGYRVVHVDEATAYDRMPATPAGEFRTRVRMTLRNWQGTWSRGELLNPFRHPRYAWALWSHKVLRWLSPYFFLTVVVVSVLLAPGSWFFQWVCFALCVLFLAGIIGYLAQRHQVAVPLVGTAYSFLLANAGFLQGTMMAVLGRKITRYT
ncbi:glycosyltransferase [Thermodesulfobacteriota bacterium B35]